MSARPSATRRRFVQGAAIAPFFIGRSASAGDALVLKLATVAPSDTPWANQISKLKKLVKERSGGALKIKPYLGAALGDEIETAAKCKAGGIEIFAGSVGALTTAVPELEAIELPYLFKSKITVTKDDHRVLQADHILDSVVHERLQKLLWSAGYKLLFLAENGFRSIGSTFPVEKLADLKGRKMRSQQNESHLDTWRALGALPVPTPVNEVVTALQQGVVDGFDNTPLFAFAASWYVAISHFTVTEHIYQPGAAVISRKVWEKLDVAFKEILLGTDAERQEFTVNGRDAVRRMGKQLIENFRTAGIIVNELSDVERTLFLGAAMAAHTKFEKRTSAEGRALLKDITAAL